jgi:hypothetical protein
MAHRFVTGAGASLAGALAHRGSSGFASASAVGVGLRGVALDDGEEPLEVLVEPRQLAHERRHRRLVEAVAHLRAEERDVAHAADSSLVRLDALLEPEEEEAVPARAGDVPSRSPRASCSARPSYSKPSAQTVTSCATPSKTRRRTVPTGGTRGSRGSVACTTCSASRQGLRRSPPWPWPAHAPALGHLRRRAGGCARARSREPALGQLLDAPGEALLQVVLVPRPRRLAVELAPLLGELADGHRLERRELSGDVVELAHRGAGSGGRLVVHRASVVRARTVLARRRHDGFFPGRRQGESRREQRGHDVPPCAAALPAALLLAPHVEERLGEDVSRLVETSLDLGAALLGAHGGGCGRAGPRLRDRRFHRWETRSGAPKRDRRSSPTSTSPLTGEALFSI